MRYIALTRGTHRLYYLVPLDRSNRAFPNPWQVADLLEQPDVELDTGRDASGPGQDVRGGGQEHDPGIENVPPQYDEDDANREPGGDTSEDTSGDDGEGSGVSQESSGGWRSAIRWLRGNR